MAILKHPHRGTGKIRFVYVKNETITIEGEVVLGERGKIENVYGKAELWLDAEDARHPNNLFHPQTMFVNDDINPTIPLEFDPKKQQFFYVLDEQGRWFESSFEYWKQDKYQQLLAFTGKTSATCS